MNLFTFSVPVTGLAVAAAICLTGGNAALAAPIFSQTPTITTATGADRNGSPPQRIATAFELGAAGTARSVTWRGMYWNGTFTFPTSFNLAILENDSNNLPGTAVSVIDVEFDNINQYVDTGLRSGSSNQRVIYEFSANLAPAALEANTTYWFALLADTDGDHFWWSAGSDPGIGSAFQNLNSNGDYDSSGIGPMYFVLDDQPIPEPTSLSLLVLTSGLLLRRK